MQELARETATQSRLVRWLTSPLGQLQILLALAVAFGGGGVSNGLHNLVVQLAALMVLILQWHRVRAFFSEAPPVLVALTLATLAIPLLQLVPLPSTIWQSLPGRDLVVQSFVAAGIEPDSWLPFSLDRGRTLTAFIGLVAPATILMIGATLDGQNKARLARFVAWAALAALALGLIQLASANSSAVLYDFNNKAGVLYATFANRNSTGAFFAIALVLLVVVPASNSRAMMFATVAGTALLALGVVLTQSRSGMVLCVLALGFVLVRAGMIALASRKRGAGPGRAGWAAGALAALLVIGVMAGSVALGGRASEAIGRFDDTETSRPEMWEDGAYAAQQYWPLGSGMGTFDEVFQIHESLEYISQRRAGRAHSDVLEVVIEAGLVGAVLALLWLIWALQAALRAPEYWRWPALGAGMGVLLLLAQSLLDYPLRTQTLLCVAAVLLAMLARRRERAA